MKNNSVLDVIDRSFNDVLSEKYLAYALSTIMARSLPDVRDGLKPVHRRLIYAMRQMNLRSDGMPKKSARIVGDVMGKFHPHGDAAIYETLVRLTQDFAVRYPLIYGQGNFGNIDGDNAAAMRYTESKMTTVAEALLEDIDSDTVDFHDTYDGDGTEPDVLPAAFPNLLANGAIGIAVGMATSIPPHNVGELCGALEKLIDKKSATVAELMEFISGPDFPTGGVMVETLESILNSYETGRGSFRLRAKWMEEKLPQGQYQIVITEIPYQVQKSNLIERIADLLQEKKLSLLDDIRDESAEDVRVVLVPKSRTVDAAILMESLFKSSDLETRFPLNMNVLDKHHRPSVMNLKQVLQAFLDHRHEVLLRRSQFRLNKIEARVEILDGYLIAYLNLDKVIHIIRTEDEPKQVLISTFALAEIQADAILNMRLRNLRKLEEMEIRGERNGLLKEGAGLTELLNDEKKRWKTIKEQIRQIKKQFGDDKVLGPRRTLLAEAPQLGDISFEAMIEREPITVLCSEQGWIRALKGHVKDAAIEQKYKEGDKERFVIEGYTTDKFIFFASDGRFFTVGGDKFPGGRGFGDPVRLMVSMGDNTDILTFFKYDEKAKMLVAASDGRGFVVPMKDVLAQTKNGKAVLTMPDKIKAIICSIIPEGHDTVATIGDNRKILIFPLSQLPEMGRGRGVTLQKFKDGGLSDAKTLRYIDGLTWYRGSMSKGDMLPWIGARASSGRLAPQGFPRNNKLS
ncbi:MAG: parC [Alphaproteobacteria bacterium]|nr:parC [Alphaproteobacteria bacterium]